MTSFRSNHATVRSVIWIVLLLLIASSMTEFSAAQTASAAANQRRTLFTQKLALSPANSPNPSSLGAISASVDAAVDWRVNADRENQLTDPGLSPLRITAPNVNGEDEASAQTQPEISTPANSGRANDNSIPRFTSVWGPALKSRGLDALQLSDRSQVNLVHKRRVSTRGSNRAHRTENASSHPGSSLGVEDTLRQNRVHASSLTGINKARHQQEIHWRDCNRLTLNDMQCGPKLQQGGVSSSGGNAIQSYRKSLSAIH